MSNVLKWAELVDALTTLEKIDVITTDPSEVLCCGMERDQYGRCRNRGYHPILVKIGLDNSHDS